jgi:hypothetical protein
MKKSAGARTGVSSQDDSALSCAASTSKEQDKELPCVLTCPNRCLPPLDPHVRADLLAALKPRRSSDDHHIDSQAKMIGQS